MTAESLEDLVHAARDGDRESLERLVLSIQDRIHGLAVRMLWNPEDARDATQVFGGYGFMNEYVVARHYRDSKILEIGEGTTEVQLMLIAREAGL